MDSVDSLAATATSGSSSGSATKLQESGGLPGAGEQASEAPSRGSRTCSDETDEVAGLRRRLGSVEQERNVLANTLEWKELEWRDLAEVAQLDMEEMRRAHQGEVARLESQIQAMERAARERLEAAPAPAPERLPSALRWLLPGLRAQGPQGPGQPLCQDACWGLLAALPDTVALRCRARDYAVTEATREAGRIWGSGTILGRSALALTNAQSSAWLREALDSHQGVMEQEKAMAGFPGFVVQDLGCEAFTSRKGEELDFEILAMSFLAETAHGGQAEIMIVLSTERGASFAPAWLSQSTGPPSRTLLSEHTLLSEQSEESCGRSGASGEPQEPPMSEVSTGAVGPDDSASNLCF